MDQRALGSGRGSNIGSFGGRLRHNEAHAVLGGRRKAWTLTSSTQPGG